MESFQLSPLYVRDSGQFRAFGRQLPQRQFRRAAAPESASIRDDRNILSAREKPKGNCLDRALQPGSKDQVLPHRKVRKQSIGFRVRQEIVTSLAEDDLLPSEQRIGGHGEGIVHFDVLSGGKQREMKLALAAGSVNAMDRRAAVAQLHRAMRFKGGHERSVIALRPCNHGPKLRNQLGAVRHREGPGRITEIMLRIDVNQYAFKYSPFFSGSHV